MLDGRADQGAMLVHIDRWRFAGGTHDNNAIGTLGNMPIEQFAQAGQVERTIVKHRRNDGGK